MKPIKNLIILKAILKLLILCFRWGVEEWLQTKIGAYYNLAKF
jgi:hypothetical protein